MDAAIWIVEIKSSIADFRADTKWRDYRAHCDKLYFAIPETMPIEIMPDDAGLILTDAYGAEILREAPEHRLAPSTRRAMLIRFAHAAANRRKRFSLAHELGHMVIAPSGGVDEEKAAHRFGGAFLMPADVLRAEVGVNRSSISIGELVVLKKRFGVSIQALTYRCKDLGIINQATFGRLFKIFAGADGERRHSRNRRRCCRSWRSRSASSGYAIGRLPSVSSARRAAELLGISVRELDARLNQVAA